MAFPLAIWALLALWSRRNDPFAQRGACARSTEELKHAPGSTNRSLRRLGLAGLIALAMTAFYWLPVMLESQYVWIAQDVGGLGFEGHLAPLQTWVTTGASYRYFPDQGVQAEHPLSWAQVALLGFALLVGGMRTLFYRVHTSRDACATNLHTSSDAYATHAGGVGFHSRIGLDQVRPWCASTSNLIGPYVRPIT